MKTETPAFIVLPEIRSTALSIQYFSPEFRRCAGTLSCRATCRENKLRTGDHYHSFAWFIAALLIAIAAYYVPRDSAVLREQVQKRAQEQAG